jgi:hypothetical protein
MAKQYERKLKCYEEHLGNTLGTFKKFPSPPKEKKKRFLVHVEAFFLLHEICIFKIGFHHFQPSLTPGYKLKVLINAIPWHDK